MTEGPMAEGIERIEELLRARHMPAARKRRAHALASSVRHLRPFA